MTWGGAAWKRTGLTWDTFDGEQRKAFARFVGTRGWKRVPIVGRWELMRFVPKVRSDNTGVLLLYQNRYGNVTGDERARKLVAEWKATQ